MWKWENITDSRLSQLLIIEINSVLVLLQSVVVGNIANVLEVYVASGSKRIYAQELINLQKHIPPKRQQYHPQPRSVITQEHT
jgi:hypothetical protein